MIRSAELDRLIAAGEALEVKVDSRTVVLKDGKKLMRCSACGDGYDGYLLRVKGYPEMCMACAARYAKEHGAEALFRAISKHGAFVHIGGEWKPIADAAVQLAISQLLKGIQIKL